MPDAGEADFSGKTVLIIHPAWHSCGSHAVFCSQAAAYKEMGALVVSLAVGTTLLQRSRNRSFWSHYYRMTENLAAHERYHTGPSTYSLLLDSRLLRALKLARSNYAAQMAGISELSPLPRAFARSGHIDLIHCNHYFNMPLALRLKARFGAPILLETHDVQSRQYELRGATPLFSNRRSSLDEMEKSELELVAQADELVHINAEEYAYFSERLPRHKHALLYPAIDMKRRLLEPLFLTVASANYPNYLSIEWLLERALPVDGPVRLAIVGNVDEEFKRRAPRLYERHRQSFIGRADNLEAYYGAATAVLLPTVAGHGLSIKTVEALASGAPLIATRLAFRGMALDLDKIEDLQLADAPEEFARHISAANASACDATLRRRQRAGATSRKVFEDFFSFAHYEENLRRIVSGLGLAGAAAEMHAAHLSDLNMLRVPLAGSKKPRAA